MKFKKPSIRYVLDGDTSRPSWTSTPETGSLTAFKHRHMVERGKFVLRKNYFVKTRGMR
jgi:hypothetical protein